METPVGQNREEILWFHSLLILKGPIDFLPHALLFVSLTLSLQGHTLLIAHHFHSIGSADLGVPQSQEYSFTCTWIFSLLSK